ncbi:MAG: hypothetical protein Q7Q73_01220 [Verrucomicrobiota bacterium JB024]|nr:hypothetical protein [Verrucomicrobiota bacterium JB024]
MEMINGEVHRAHINSEVIFPPDKKSRLYKIWVNDVAWDKPHEKEHINDNKKNEIINDICRYIVSIDHDYVIMK